MPGRWSAKAVAIALCAGIVLACPDKAGATEPVAEESPQPQVAPQDLEKTETESEFKPPPGWRAKRRGDKVVYCRKELVEGTRFTKDKCYDKVQLKEIESLTEQQRREMDQRRRICPNPTACG